MVHIDFPMPLEDTCAAANQLIAGLAELEEKQTISGWGAGYFVDGGKLRVEFPSKDDAMKAKLALYEA